MSLVALALLIGGCSGSDGDDEASSASSTPSAGSSAPAATPPPAPPSTSASPTPPPYGGRLIGVTSDNQLAEVAFLSASTARVVPIGPIPAGANVTVSPDGSRFAYTLDGAAYVGNLADGKTEPIAAKAGLSGSGHADFDDCHSWSPDGRHLALVDETGLYLTQLDGSAIAVSQRKSASYVRSDGGKVTLRSDVSCPVWIDKTRFLFDRVKTMPDQTITFGNSEIVGGDTTTLADTTKSGLVVGDAPGQWFVHGACNGRVLASDQDTRMRDDKVETFHLVEMTPGARTFPALDKANEVPLPPLTGEHPSRFGGIAPAGCSPYIFSADDYQQPVSLFAVDPATRQPRQIGATNSPVWPEYGILAFERLPWSPNPDAPVFAQAGQDPTGKVRSTTSIIDLRDPAVKPITGAGVEKIIEIVAWLPSPRS